MTIQELFITANQELAKVVSQISDDQWDLDMPAGTSYEPTKLKAAIQYHTYDDAWVPDILAGKTKDEVGDTYDFLRSDDAVQNNYRIYNEHAIAAVRDFSNLDRETHLSYGDFPAHDYLQHVTSFRAFRVYDIAKLIGIDTTMDPTFVQALLEEYTPVIENYRQMGVFPAALSVTDDSSPQVKLLAMVGRS